MFHFYGVGDDVFEFGDVVGEAFASGGGEFAGGLGFGASEGFFDVDDGGVLEDGEVAAEVAIGEAAEFLEVVEEEAVGV